MISLYASVGPELTHYHLDVEAGTLARKASVRAPQDIQYIWPHVSKQTLYVASSDSMPKSAAPDRPPGTQHHITAFKVAADGALSPHGKSMLLPSRPVHISTDIPSKHVLAAFNSPSGLTVYGINADGTLGGEVSRAKPADCGIFAHQVRVAPDNRMVILVTRGNEAAEGKPEDPGALKIFQYADGRLGDCATVAPHGGHGFGPRHLDFHPTQPWIYLSIEIQNQMMLFRRKGDALEAAPAFVKDTLLETGNIRSKQMAGTVHVHPKGHAVYGVNRAWLPSHGKSLLDVAGKKVLPGGENSIVVYKIDPATGEPTAIQHEDTRGTYCRTFHIDPSGRLLVAGNLQPLHVMVGGEVKFLPASMALFRIGEDGRLTYLRKYDIDVGAKNLFWVGMI